MTICEKHMAALNKAMLDAMHTCATGTVAEKLRATSNALYMTAKCTGHMSEEEWTNRMALLSGMAAGCMTDAAQLLEEV